MNNFRHVIKLLGRRIAGTWGRTAKKYHKRIANKATRRYNKKINQPLPTTTEK